MKAVHMSASQDVVVDFDSLPLSRGRNAGFHTALSNVRRAHSRSASWSLPSGQGADFGRGLVTLNPMTPITNAIREIVPTFAQLSRTSNSNSRSNSRASPHMSREASQTSLLLGTSEMEEGQPQTRLEETQESQDLSSGHDSLRTSGDSSSNVHVHLPHDHVTVPMGTHAPPEDASVGLELSDSMKWLEQNAIFFLLLLMKFAWYHRSGLMVILGMFGTFFHCNQVIRHQVALKNRRQIPVLFLVIIFLAGNIYFVYYVFWEQRLHVCLIFLAPHFTVDLLNLIWSIWVTDYIIRFGTMALKALVAAMFLPLLPARSKGKYYMLLEYVSQLYRTLVPTPLWVRYLSNPLLTGAVFAVLITAVYLMIKGGILFTSVRSLYKAVIVFLKDQLYGRPPSPEEFAAVSSHQCAICQDDFSRPLLLPCQHIFCENCVLQWLDRQNTCPLCRSPIGSHAPKWRDGSTATWPQIF